MKRIIKTQYFIPLLGALSLLYCAIAVANGAVNSDPSGCISLDEEYNSPVFVNSCDRELDVRWFDDGACSTPCSTTIPPMGRAMVSSARGTVRVAACEYPEIVSGEWKGFGPYSCR